MWDLILWEENSGCNLMVYSHSDYPPKCSFLNGVTHSFHGFNQLTCIDSGNFSGRRQATFLTVCCLYIVSLNIFQASFEAHTLLSSSILFPVLPTLVDMLFSGIILFFLLGCSSFLSIPGRFTLQSPASPMCFRF